MFITDASAVTFLASGTKFIVQDLFSPLVRENLVPDMRLRLRRYFSTCAGIKELQCACTKLRKQMKDSSIMNSYSV
ncbi:hypothetical protein HMPREF9555_02032 [Selenomonas artemidis F0399]|uniref:Uncharacterized protein n=1 Tax=Selenomonas artemidis F0399 TaxID=749551 RepID=E7N4T7_9FIRM|nr:hypothetical protein HMPREF9555_02032 [Selenomonas artemidis F0399]